MLGAVCRRGLLLRLLRSSVLRGGWCPVCRRCLLRGGPHLLVGSGSLGRALRSSLLLVAARSIALLRSACVALHL